MKISRQWLQRYFEKPLPDAGALGDALTFHAFEIESIENDILDVKVTPNRGHDCLSHRGIAKELSAILQLPMKSDPLRHVPTLAPATNLIAVSVEEPALCPRFTACRIKNIRVGPSPDWLRTHLESIGQKSINNIVDATNFMMFDLGQPLHAFDAGKLTEKDGAYSLIVRKGNIGEALTGLDDRQYTLAPSMLVIADSFTGSVLSIAGIKGGKQSGIDEATTDIILEGANWDGVTIRKASQALKLRTDASMRFEQVISPELTAFGVHAAANLIVEIAGGEVVGFVDEYPITIEKKAVLASTAHINAILGSALSDGDVGDALTRLDLAHVEQSGRFIVHAPFERLDLTIPEDIAEEVGRIVGYDKIKPSELPPLSKKPEINPDFFAAEAAREDLIAKGYSEVYTSVFAEKGERVVANKVDGVKPYLRTTLIDGLTDALERNRRIKDILGLNDVKLFEIGVVWKDGKPARPGDPGRSGGEITMLGIADEKGVREEPLIARQEETSYADLPLSNAERYQPFSKYPFIVRDIAMWVPFDSAEGKSAATPEEVHDMIRKNAGELLVRSHLFDQFEKGEKTSLAFRLVFQSFDRTLTDFDANERVGSISEALKSKGFEIR
ncbi:hypothetical protein A2765_06605 [Candidatus Kaiserbacteria bacterium RIFCSPHIGHO2_01_FULL_56_24]|uniref:Uncharacterized protein n=1 Tax=Candidatus Kaiserbacteria bacterium RIFCSPHIGHO2_01_FULL_56_24 TaxID=1798487 RepID=A0A1F6DB75_9BACT|nr:MAG: hypothetical protein A2765_06605 [Candidatus Kaiserbacteria bacterium RIFCSPHIGHO2_01_FULL_56_24]